MTQLCFYSDQQLFDRVRLGQRPITIGRGRTCTVQLRDERVSRVHVVIRPRIRNVGGRDITVYELEDRSLNGTKVNGTAVDEVTTIRPGDRIEIEDFLIVHRGDDEGTVPRLGSSRPSEHRTASSRGATLKRPRPA